MTPVLFHFHRDRKRRDVRAMGNTETNTRNHGPPFSLLPPARSFSRLFHHFSRGSYTLWERALATRVIIAAPVSWKKKEKKKSRWKIEVEGNKESGLCSCPFLFLFSPGKRREERNSSSAPVSYREKGGGSRCLPDVSDASVPLATTIYGRKCGCHRFIEIFETCRPRARRSPRCFFSLSSTELIQFKDCKSGSLF